MRAIMNLNNLIVRHKAQGLRRKGNKLNAESSKLKESSFSDFRNPKSAIENFCALLWHSAGNYPTSAFPLPISINRFPP
jgi:hypothetical protein